jgi:hypothetical protein
MEGEGVSFALAFGDESLLQIVLLPCYRRQAGRSSRSGSTEDGGSGLPYVWGANEA